MTEVFNRLPIVNEVFFVFSPFVRLNKIGRCFKQVLHQAVMTTTPANTHLWLGCVFVWIMTLYFIQHGM